MSIEVLDAAEDHLLTTLVVVKQNLNLADATHDALLNSLIAGMSDFVKNYCGRSFAKERVLEKVAGKGLPNILLSLTPIISVESVVFQEQDITDYVIYDKDSGILQRKKGFTDTNLPWNTINLHPSSYYEKDWEITYTGGYVLPGWGAGQTRTLPFDLERAVLDMVKMYFKKRDLDPTLTHYRIGETQASWKGGVDTVGFSESVSTILNFYRRAF